MDTLAPERKCAQRGLLGWPSLQCVRTRSCGLMNVAGRHVVTRPEMKPPTQRVHSLPLLFIDTMFVHKPVL